MVNPKKSNKADDPAAAAAAANHNNDDEDDVLTLMELIRAATSASYEGDYEQQQGTVKEELNQKDETKDK